MYVYMYTFMYIYIYIYVQYIQAFDLSGGNPFWVNEISSFLLTYGWEEFISSLKVDEKNNEGIVINIYMCVYMFFLDTYVYVYLGSLFQV
jgi:hypothetical protein